MQNKELISSETALKIVLENRQNYGVESLPIENAIGRILAEDVLADRDFPPFDRVTMDGIAINYDGYLNQIKEGNCSLSIEHIQLAGEEIKSLNNVVNCIEVMTGSVLPINCDTVIRYEDIEIINNIALCKLSFVNIIKNQNVHNQGSDKEKGNILIKKNTTISAMEIAILAAVGKPFCSVIKLPKIAIVSTGDELIDINQIPQPHQIRKSNSYMMVSHLRGKGHYANQFHLNDDKSELKINLQLLLFDYDILILSGGVSAGKADFVPEVLAEIGVKELFHKVAQRPGKPIWFGVKSNDKSDVSKIVFGLPGNPVSTSVCFLKYVMQFLREDQIIKFAKIADRITFKPILTYYVPVAVENKNGEIWAKPFVGNGSGDFTNLVDADGFLELPANKSSFEIGEIFPYFTYRN